MVLRRGSVGFISLPKGFVASQSQESQLLGIQYSSGLCTRWDMSALRVMLRRLSGLECHKRNKSSCHNCKHNRIETKVWR